LVRDDAGEVVAGQRDLLAVAHELPGLREDAILLEREDVRIPIPRRRNRRGGREVLLERVPGGGRHGCSFRPPFAFGAGAGFADRSAPVSGVAMALRRSSRNWAMRAAVFSGRFPWREKRPGSSSSVSSASWKRSTVHSIMETIISSSMSERTSPRSTPIRTKAAVP